MKPIIVLFLGVLLWGCAPRGDDHSWMFVHQEQAQEQSQDKARQAQDETALRQETEITVSVVPDQVMEYVEICERLISASRDQGVEELLHLFVSQAPMVRPVGERSDDVSNGEAVSPVDAVLDQCDPWLDPVTNLVRQRSAFSVELVPKRGLGGVIDALQDDQTMGGMLSRAYVSLWGPPVGPTPIPVLIVQHPSGFAQARNQGLVQVVGSGLITQVSEPIGQMRILESTREIFPGDMFFQLQVRTSVQPMVGDMLPLSPEERK